MPYLGERGVLCVGNGWHFCTPVLMNMCNITFEGPGLSTFVFKKSSKKYSWFKAKGVFLNIVGPTSQTVAQYYFTIGPMYRVMWVVAFRGMRRQPYGSRSKRGTITQFFSMLGQRRIRLTGIESAMGCDAGPTLNRYWVGRPTLCVSGTSYRRVHWLFSGDGGRNRPTRWKNTCLLGSFNNYFLDI